MNRPIIAITMGEAAGIGPEICLKALSHKTLRHSCRPILLGDATVFQRELDKLLPSFQTPISLRMLPLSHFWKMDLNSIPDSEIIVCDFQNISPHLIPYGEDTAVGGKASGDYIAQAIQWALEEKVDAIVTAPISKQAFKMGGWNYPGHTEMLADLTHTDRYTMMLGAGPLKVVHVSSHLPLADVPAYITQNRVLNTIRLAQQAAQMFGLTHPHIAVCGLNPHAGEGGLLGREEIEIIQPAVEQAQAEGIHVQGPLPADTIWSQVVSGYYDMAVAMYHDQGGIPVKLLGARSRADGTCEHFSGINVTVGLPIIRVSVDHGTAYPIAGKGVASEASMVNAIETAVVLAKAASIK